MSLNKTGTNTEKTLTANVGKIIMNDLKIRTSDNSEGSITYKAYTPSTLTTDSPSLLTIDDSTFIYRLSSNGGAELVLHIVFAIDINMLGVSGNQRGFTFSLPTEITTEFTSGTFAVGYLTGLPESAPVGLLNNIYQVTNPSTSTVNVLFKNGNSTQYAAGVHFARGEVVLRIGTL